MSIENRIATGYRHFFENDIENSLIQTSIAMDAFSKKKYKIKKVGKRIKMFLKNNIDVISFIGTFGRLTVTDGITVGDRKLESIIYDLVRNCVIHEGKLPDEVAFIEGDTIFRPKDKIELNKSFVLAILISIIVDDEDKILKLSNLNNFFLGGKRVQISNIHGNRKALFDVVSRVQSA